MNNRSATSAPKRPAASAQADESNPPPYRPEDEEEERRSFANIIAAFRYYRTYSNSRVNKTESYLNSLNERHQDMLAKYRSHINVIRDCIDVNYNVIQQMIRDVPYFFDQASNNFVMQNDIERHTTKQIKHQDMENPHHVEPFKLLKVQTTLKQFARDWSLEGAEERNQSYKPIIDAIEQIYRINGEIELNEIKILVPGAGLGRLAYELALRGYFCEGNEYSYFMLIASNFVLNKCAEENQYTLFPWVHQYVNNLRKADQVSPIRFPDICPSKNPPSGEIRMSAGDFLLVYKTPFSYDCVATCFFIDCANNIVEFIETIYKILVPGGYWINLGPLLYHYSDIHNENSIEPTYEDLMQIIEMVGFDIVKSETGLHTKYAQNPKSMLKSGYESLFWICRKPTTATLADNENPIDNSDGDNRIYTNG